MGERKVFSVNCAGKTRYHIQKCEVTIHHIQKWTQNGSKDLNESAKTIKLKKKKQENHHGAGFGSDSLELI